ncbi:MAG: protein kinase, partial [Chloroflexi bacterium]|nr:protein kinase [Chloroflexota bacterium]
MVLCPSCGYQNREGAVFCGECGTPLADSTACPACSASNPRGHKFCGACGQPLVATATRTPTPRPSPTLPAAFSSGRYQVRSFLGEGGKKRVYLAHDTRLDRDVAFALIKTEGLDEAGLVRVRREAQAMGRLGDHPNVVTVYDIGEEDGQPYIVSQHMAGGDLEGRLAQAENRRLPLDQALRVADEVCQALEHAHGRGIVHRDLKPGNVWLATDGTAKLGDFGLAIALDRSRLTMAGMMVGTVAYMPPEQALGRASDARGDLYSLGCVLYEIVTGRPPFLGDDAVAIISQHINTAPVAPSWHNPEIPRALEALILRLLAKTPEERPERAAAVRQALSAIASTASTVAERVVQEEANPLDRLAGGVFVGREKELDELRAGLEDALSAHGRLLMLVGEPGIGKTRTAEELATYARLRGVQVLWGRCYEGEGAPAYWPWVQVIRSYAYDRDPKDLMSDMGPGAADIAQVVSEVRERLPGLPTPPTLEPEQARFRLFDSVTTFLRSASKRHPIVLVLDDLHWADKPSLLLLQFLAREMRGARLMVLATYRDVEVRRHHPLSQTLAELNREGLSQRILLRGLSEHDVARFIELTAGRAPPESLVEAVYKETEGNPFFVNEIVRLLVADGRLEQPEAVKSWSVTIPQSVREVVGRRLDHLSDECNRVLTVASVIGREFGLDALEHVSDVSGDRLLEALEEAMGARVISEVPRAVGRYTFTHALIRETLYEELTTTRRVRLHRQVGAVLEELYAKNPDPYLAELAYHFCEGAQGGDVDKAVDYARRAGERAMSLLAYEEAVGHYELALQALELKEPPDEWRRCELLLALGDAQWRAGDTDGSRETFQRAAEVARKLGSARHLARAAVGFGSYFEAGLVDEPLLALLHEALAALGDGDSGLKARVLGRLAMGLYFTAPKEERLVLADQGIEVARRVGDKGALAFALTAKHQALWELDTVEQRLAATEEMIRLAEEAGEKELEGGTHLWRLLDYLELGDIRGVDAELEIFGRLAEELRQPWHLWNLAQMRGMRAMLDGRFEEGERLAQQALALGQRGQVANALQLFAVQTYLLRREQGRLQELEAPMKAFVAQYPLVPAWRTGLAFLYAEQGREAEAREEFERLVADDFAALPISRYLGTLATTMNRRKEAEQHFQDDLQAHEEMGAKPRLAWTRYGYADMLLRRDAPDDRQKALELLAQALSTAQELGMKKLVERALALKLQAQGLSSTDVRTSIDAVASAVYVEKPDLRPHAAPDGTVTILFTDIEDSARLTERLGDRRWVEVLRAHNALVRQQVAAHDGFEVKSEGDGFMVAFQSARRALQCAVAIQRAFAERNRSARPEPVEGSPERSEGR